MQEKNEKYQLVLAAIEDGYFEVDLAGNILLCNEALARLTGCRLEELAGVSYRKYMEAETARLVKSVFNQVFRTAEPVKGFEWELLRLDGSTVWVETSVSPIFDETRTIVGFRGILRDISSRKKAEQLLTYQLQFEKVLAEISSDLAICDESNLDLHIDQALAKLGDFVGADRSYLFLFSSDMKTTSNTHEWCAPGISPQKDNLQELPTDVFRWWMKQLNVHPYLFVPSLAQLPAEAAVEKEILAMQEIQSLVVVPVPGPSPSNLLGFLGFDAVREKREWSEDSIRLLGMAAQMISYAVQRCQSLAAVRESARFLQNIVDFSPDPFFAIDGEGKVTVWNRAMEDLTGVKAGEIIGKGNYEYALPLYGSRRPLLVDLAMLPDPELEQQYENLWKERRMLTAESRVPLLGDAVLWSKAEPLYDQEGKIIGAVQSIRDITDRVQSEEKLRRTASELNAILEALPDIYVRVAADSTILDARAGVNVNLHLDIQKVRGKKLSELVPASLSDDIENAVMEVIQNRTPLVKHFIWANSEENCFEAHFVPLFTDQAIVVVRDVTERHRYMQHLRYMSLYDNLTGVYNRNFFQEELQRLENMNRPGLSLGIMICDLDALKLVNDVLGHLAGDRLLETFAHILKQCFGDKANIARTGGDEFVVFFPGHDEKDIEVAYENLQQAVSLYNSSNPELTLSISVGFAVGTIPDLSVSELLEKADNNMYQAKLQQYEASRAYLKETLVKSLGERDFLVQGHGERVEKVVTLLAQAVGVPKGKLDDLRLLSHFHDIGKIRVPEAILKKPGPLSLEEKKEIEKHCSVGHRIALSSPELVPIAEWILCHHERWDGSGYPLGLKGTQIPFESRLLAIADAYDAMTNDRPYRKAMSRARAVAELKACAGTQFDPHLVEKFISVVLPALNSYE